MDAGGEVIITQLFYDTDTFFQFVKDCREFGINCPILPGIMPIQAYGGFKRMTGFCRTRVPAEVADALEAIKDDEAAVKAFGIQLATDSCKKILDSGLGLNGVHFYTLNLEKTTFAVMESLGLLKQAVGEASSKKEEDTLKGTHIA